MKCMPRSFVGAATVGVLCLSLAAHAGAEAPTEPITSRSADVGGLEIHYLTAGKGPALVLLHGYAETSRMWRPIIPVLAEKFTVIAPDLPGIGDSSIPTGDVDMKTAANTHPRSGSRARNPEGRRRRT